MRTTIFSFAVNDKFPISLQYKQFHKYLKDSFEFILVNDAGSIEMRNKLTDTANELKIEKVLVPQEIHKVHNPSVCYANALNWLLKTHIKDKNLEIIMIVHADVFCIYPVSILEAIENYTIASTMEVRILENDTIYYLYPALMLINMKTIKDIDSLNFDCGRVEKIKDDKIISVGLDTGGMTYEYIEKYRNDIKFLVNHQASRTNSYLQFDDMTQNYCKYDYKVCRKHKLNAAWYVDGLYHYVAGSQWNVIDLKLEKDKFVADMKKCEDTKLVASAFIKKWYLYCINKKRVIGNFRRFHTLELFKS